MPCAQYALVFDSEGEALPGILHTAEDPHDVLVMVDGSQYCLGSRRQFVLLAGT